MKSLLVVAIALSSSFAFANPCSNISSVNLGYKAELYAGDNNVDMTVTHPNGDTETVYCGEQASLQCQQPESGQIFQTVVSSSTVTVTYNNYGNDTQVFSCQL